ncbi:disulfide bond formation protein B [Thauera butanivorans]|uniref:disulfide bond formation protein B n=1 Tax=Thauera butanivorans TaxID=86174 RepID=UPI000ADB10E9|nr:disulfide bond formation protein B [Thauera butanivorans]
MPSNRADKLTYLFLAWLIALISTATAVFLGEIMGQPPCDLCWYQRIAMFPLAVILGIANFRDDATAWIYALPLAVAGSVLALVHTTTYLSALPEVIEVARTMGPSCTDRSMQVMGIPLPLLSLASFLSMTALLTTVSIKDHS